MSADAVLSIQQRQLGEAIRDAGAVEALIACCSGDAERIRRAAAIYRGNVLMHSGQALRSHFPVIEQVVGEEFFRGLARAYWLAQPSRGGDLGRYGDGFAAFLASFEPVSHLPYLADLACLEWAVHQAEDAADAPTQPISREPALLWQPGTTVLRAEHPIADMWNAHQPDATLAIDAIEWRAQGALVYRDGLRVAVAPLDADQASALLELITTD